MAAGEETRVPLLLLQIKRPIDHGVRFGPFLSNVPSAVSVELMLHKPRAGNKFLVVSIFTFLIIDQQKIIR